MNKDLIHRSLNVGFSGGEKKKNEVLQIKLLTPKFIILDELDSGLDVDAVKTVSRGIQTFQQDDQKSLLSSLTTAKSLNISISIMFIS